MDPHVVTVSPFTFPMEIPIVTLSGAVCCTLTIDSFATRVVEMKSMVERSTCIPRDEQDIVPEGLTVPMDDRCRLHHYADALFRCRRMFLIRKCPKPSDPAVMARLRKEIALVPEDAFTAGYTLGPVAGDLDTDPLHWAACIVGPAGCPYEGGVFKLKISIPRDYPFSPPSIEFATRIFHPLVTSTGSIDLDLLYDKWSPVFTLSAIVKQIRSFLEHPYYLGDIAHAECLCGNAEAAALSKDRGAFDQHARQFTQTYACTASG